MKVLLNKKFYFIFLFDAVLVIASLYLAYAIRFEFQIPAWYLEVVYSNLPLILTVKMAVFILFNVYRGMWRYTSLVDIINVVKAVSIASLIVLGVIMLKHRFEGFPRSVFIIDYILSLMFIAGLRIGIRLYYQSLGNSLPSSSLLGRLAVKTDRKKLLIVGAGDAAEKVVREIFDNKALPYKIVGLVDDDSAKIGRSLHGIPVLGALVDLKEVIAKTEPSEILIAMPSAARDQMGRVVQFCQGSGLPFKTLPGMGEIINDKVSIKSIRDVSYKDLLGRPAVRLELEKIEEVLKGRTVVVTGAGGSIGSELCRQIIRFKPKLLILFDAGEENLYRIEMELLHDLGFADYVTILGKVQIENLLHHVFSKYKPDVVFHAAAYKHVPMIERNPWEAVYNNIIATNCLIKASVRSGVRRFILVSTDKAVRPTNVMGTSKRVTEKLMQAYSCCQKQWLREEDDNNMENGRITRFMAVRFGNVLGSSGSVIPLFKKQIERGGPVTVTHPEITRYFMSIEEAAQLILQAGSMDKGRELGDFEGGEIFVLEMGTSVKISQMARDLIRLCGKEPDTEIEIKYSGLRPGEKLFEELITEGEGILATDHEKIMVLQTNSMDWDGFVELMKKLEELKADAKDHDGKAIKAKLKELVPEYSPEDIGAVL